MTKKIGAMIRDTQQFLMQSADGSQFSRSVSFMIPFQLSPVATLKRVRKAIPKFAKWACSPRPWHGWSSSHSIQRDVNRAWKGDGKTSLNFLTLHAIDSYQVDQRVRLPVRRIWRKASRREDPGCLLEAGLALQCPATNGYLWPSSATLRLFKWNPMLIRNWIEITIIVKRYLELCGGRASLGWW